MLAVHALFCLVLHCGAFVSKLCRDVFLSLLKIVSFFDRLYTALFCLQDGVTALICAIENGHYACVRVLLDAGADKEASNEVIWPMLVNMQLYFLY